MLSKAFVVAKNNWKNIKTAKIITYILMGLIIAQDIVYFILKRTGVYTINAGNTAVSIGNMLFMFIILGTFSIATSHFKKTMNLGAKRITYLNGSFLTYILMTAVISVVAILLYYTYDRYLLVEFVRADTMDIIYWFGWLGKGVVVTYLRLFAFLLLLASVLHTICIIQDSWYGWVTDFLIMAIISVFTPIAVLRKSLVWFFTMIIFHPSPTVQITSCIVLSAVIYLLNKPILARKTG
ncbi:MAG: hypothetical protein FWG21_02520 [Oscillospiraceae bacterium]|nr:hypothetical protein [Oscillospiraceae bacterium]